MDGQGVSRVPVGVVFGSLTPPEHLAEGSRLAESLGFGSLWFSEDCFFTGAMSGMTQLLANTGTIPVGLGLASTQTRHPAILAMELAGLARMYPGRVTATVGLGNAHWLDQMGLLPEKPLSSVLADLDALRSLLHGETVSRTTGPGHSFDEVTLTFPPAEVPPLMLGAVNERALRAAGAHADGVLLSVLAGPRYIKWATRHVREGAAAAGRPAPPVTAFVLASADEDADRARAAVLHAVKFFARAELTTALVSRSAVASDAEVIPPDDWDDDTRLRLVDEFAAVGTPDQVTAKLRALLDSGADSVALWVFPSDELATQLKVIAERILPLLGARDD